ncbi:hypothetical protein JCM6882_005499, partial [Rhodosporidiobolus microsporus]
ILRLCRHPPLNSRMSDFIIMIFISYMLFTPDSPAKPFLALHATSASPASPSPFSAPFEPTISSLSRERANQGEVTPLSLEVELCWGL